jgi:hypothetical protein
MPALKASREDVRRMLRRALVVKIGRERVQELIESRRARPLDPSGRDRPMKGWGSAARARG